MKINSIKHQFLLPFLKEPVTIPDYTIITGVNGSGKTIFLKAINDGAIMIDRIDPAEILYYSYEDFLVDSTPNPKAANDQYKTVAQNSANLELSECLTYLSESFKTQEEKAIVRFGRPIQFDYDLPTQKQYEFYQQCKSTLPQSYFETENDFGPLLNSIIIALSEASLDFANVDIDLAIGSYIPLIEHVSKYLEDANKYLFALYNRQPIDYALPDLFLNSVAEAEKSYRIGKEKKLLTDWYKTRFMEPNFADNYKEVAEGEESPIELLNRVLKEYDLNGFTIQCNNLYGHYESQKTQKLTLEISKGGRYSIIPYNNLSSGEKTLLTLAFFIYKVRLNYPPKALLLDEIDSFLHPSAVKHLIRVVKKVFVEEMGLKVILATHSLTTVALSPEDSVHKIDRLDPALIEQIAKTDAVNMLSEGFAALTDQDSFAYNSHKNREDDLPVIFTEGSSDAIMIDIAWKKLNPRKDKPFSVRVLNGEKNLDKELQELLKDEGGLSKSAKKHFIALFDFDAAWNTWNGDQKNFCEDYVKDPFVGLCKTTRNKQVYKMLLPVPKITEIIAQVIDGDNTFEGDSKLYMEHYFFEYYQGKFVFHKRPSSGYWKFQGNKVEFANTLNGAPAIHFTHFKQLFVTIDNILKEVII